MSAKRLVEKKKYDEALRSQVKKEIFSEENAMKQKLFSCIDEANIFVHTLKENVQFKAVVPELIRLSVKVRTLDVADK